MSRAVVCLAALTVLTWGWVLGQSGPPDEPTGSDTIADVIVDRPELSTFQAALEQAGMLEDFRGPGPMTVFAPTDDALAALPADEREVLFSSEDTLRAFLSYHVIQTDIILTPAGTMASNGAINPIDSVLILPRQIDSE